jgi:hypothetical protein
VTVFPDLTAALMAWLQEVPNLVLVLGCIDEVWNQLRTERPYTGFLDRTKQWKLDQISPAQATELIARRMRSWTDLPAGAANGWPFDLPHLERELQTTLVGPRGLIQLCATAFDKWLAEGRKGFIKVIIGDSLPLPEAFLQDWISRLEAARQAIKAPVHYQEAELWDGVREAVQIAKLGRFLPEGLQIERITPQALRKSPTDTRPSAQIDLTVGSQRQTVVVAVSKKDGGVAFGTWYDALEAATENVAGAVVVWPKAQLSVGRTARAFVKYRKRVDDGLVRPFPLDENEDGFRQLETLRVLLKDAESDNLILNGGKVNADECRKLLVETRVLANLKLFEMLFHNWPDIEAARAKPAAVAPTPATPPAPPPVPRPTTDTGVPTAVQPTTEAGTILVPPPVAPPPAPSAGEVWAGDMLTRVEQRLRAKGQPVRPAGFDLGPTFARLKVAPKDDTDFAKVKRQADNLKVHLNLEHKPLIATQAGHISIDVQRPDRQKVPLAPLLQARPAALEGQPAFPVGVDVTGKPHWLNLADPDTCHVLIAGTTGSGKSEFLKAMLAGLTDHLGPAQLQLHLIDPKQVTFNLPGVCPYLRGPVVYDAAEAIPVLEACYAEMERRYTLLRTQGKEHIGELAGADAVPRWVVVFDEFADLMADRGSKRELEALLKRLGQKARAAGIHLALGTQRPEATVVTPLLRSNLPGRISLRVIGERDSKLILEEPDAAYLLGKGDLFWRKGGGLIRLQSPLVSKAELERALRFG